MNLFPITKVNFKESPQFFLGFHTNNRQIRLIKINDGSNDGLYDDKCDGCKRQL